MEFSNRGSQPNQSGNFQNEGNPNTSEVNIRHTAPSGGSKLKRSGNSNDWSRNKTFRIVQMALMVCVVIVVVGLLVFLAITDNSNHSEGSYVQTSKLQAVFLNTGQVYFGNISSLNNNYLVLDNIFYLQTSSTGSSSSTSSSSSSANTTVSLVKLGCEIHAPLDQMVINRASVTFWENLSPSGQVAKAVTTYDKENPDGQKCSDQSSAGSSAQTTPQNATNGSTGTGTTTTGTK